MIRLTADSDFQLKDLARFVYPVEISDADGKLIGLFVPANLERGKQIYERLATNLDRAEIARRIVEEKPGQGWQELLKRMREGSVSEFVDRTTASSSSVAEIGTCDVP